MSSGPIPPGETPKGPQQQTPPPQPPQPMEASPAQRTSVPKDLLYTDSHEWVKKNNDGTVTVGITKHAVEQLTDLVYFTPPEVGRRVNKGEEAGEVESVKAVASVYSPVTGEVTEANNIEPKQLAVVTESPYDNLSLTVCLLFLLEYRV
jgi:glycine cleavage system H protein